MPAATAAPARHRAPDAREGLRCRVRLADGRVFAGPLAPERHRALQLGHPARADRRAGRARRGRPPRRPAADHDPPARRPLPARRTGRRRRLAAGAAGARRAARRRAARRCSSPRPFGRRRGATSTRSARPASCGSTSTSPTSCRRCGRSSPSGPCHLLVESSAGHAHAYWKLDRPLPATDVIESTGELVEPIERAHLRLIHHLGTDADGKPNVADPACAERSRVMRLAGSVNGKTGAHARILEADLALPAYPIGQLVGDLPDPRHVRAARAHRRRRRTRTRTSGSARASTSSGSPGSSSHATGSCTAPRTRTGSRPARSGVDASQGWRCHAGTCGARGAIYDLASVLLGGPWGPQLRGDAFRRARAYVIDVFGELPDKRQDPVKE